MNPKIVYVTDSLYPCMAVAALGRREAEEICMCNCGWFDESIKGCFNCTCPLALADKEAARRIEMQLQQLQQIRCNQLTAAVVIAACT